MRNANFVILLPMYLVVPLISEAFELNSEGKGDSSKIVVQGSLHAAAGFTSGGRLGIGLRIRSLLIEASYGNVLQNFIGATDVDRRLTVGVSWKPDEKENLTFGFLLVTRTRPGLTHPDRYFDDLYFSPVIGSLPSLKRGLGIYFRAGLTFGYLRERASSPKRFSLCGPNLDVGIFWILFEG